MYVRFFFTPCHVPLLRLTSWPRCFLFVLCCVHGTLPSLRSGTPACFCVPLCHCPNWLPVPARLPVPSPQLSILPSNIHTDLFPLLSSFLNAVLFTPFPWMSECTRWVYVSLLCEWVCQPLPRWVILLLILAVAVALRLSIICVLLGFVCLCFSHFFAYVLFACVMFFFFNLFVIFAIICFDYTWFHFIWNDWIWFELMAAHWAPVTLLVVLAGVPLFLWSFQRFLAFFPYWLLGFWVVFFLACHEGSGISFCFL